MKFKRITTVKSQTPAVGRLIHDHHLVHYTTDCYMVEKSEHFPAHSTMIIVTYKIEGLGDLGQAAHP